MAVTLAQIATRLEGKGYPCLSDSALAEIVADAEKELSTYQPFVKFVSFITSIGKTDYYIWDNTAPEYTAAAANATDVQDVFWNPGGDFSQANIFSPGFQLFNNTLLFNGNMFYRPVDMIILRQRLDAWRQQFGSQGWEVFGEIGDPTAFIRLAPVPVNDGDTVIVQVGTYYTIADIISLAAGQGRALMQWVEALAAEAVANDLSKTAGTNFGLFQSSGVGLKFWEKKAADKRKYAEDQQGGLQGQVERS